MWKFRMKIGNYYLMLLLLNKCLLIDGWKFPRVQFMTDNIYFKPRFRKKIQNQTMQIRGKTYACQPPEIISPKTYAPGIMFSIPCKVLRSATRNSNLEEWPLNENISEVLEFSFLHSSLSCLPFLWHYDFCNWVSMPIFRHQCRRFLYPPSSLSTT